MVLQAPPRMTFGRFRFDIGGSLARKCLGLRVLRLWRCERVDNGEQSTVDAICTQRFPDRDRCDPHAWPDRPPSCAERRSSGVRLRTALCEAVSMEAGTARGPDRSFADRHGSVRRLTDLLDARAELGVIGARRKVGKDLVDRAVDYGRPAVLSGHGIAPRLGSWARAYPLAA